ncbi:MAG: hypothetical protein GY724_10465 [Actinomycetia bacterium]|nr:hypothetical protein [Actinomycetes bacterium]MCP4226979.1 hypothetical protein [Actinomycetes bacterium]MCP5035348.1 hypothetical protein [Actinomycetes bacterium]
MAAIDIGTMSTKLLVTDGVSRKRRSIDTNLGGVILGANGEIRGAAISDEALSRVEAALASFKPLLGSNRALTVVATAGARRAVNNGQLVAIVERVLDAELIIISPKTEARLSYLGVVSDPGLARNGGTMSAEDGVLDRDGSVITFDVGGGSCEVAMGTWNDHEASYSIPIGGSVLTKAYLNGDPPLAEELSAALSVVELHIEDVKRELPRLVPALETAIIVGLGAISTIGAVEVGLGGGDDGAEADMSNGSGDGPLHGFVMSRDAAEDVFRTVATENRADRASNPGLPLSRVDDIVGGCAILVEILRQLDIERLVVSQRGLLDGVTSEMLLA